MTSLWESEDSSLWLKNIHCYRDVVDGCQKAQLKELDRWFFDELAPAITSRNPPHITGAELVTVVEWKLKRGKFRPRLLQYARDQSPEQVVELSTKAFAALQRGTGREEVAAALDILCAMKGIGPATASAILAAFTPQVVFMSDEALEAVVGQRNYTAKEYLELLGQLQDKAKRLLRTVEGNISLTPADLEKALYVEAVNTTAKKNVKKRKR